MSLIKAALIQHACSELSNDNLARSAERAREAAKNGANLICLQELHASLYFPQRESDENFDLAESIPGPQTEHLGDLARELNVVIVASIFERRAHGLYHNTAVVIERDGAIAGLYRKMHIPDDPGYYEKYYFTPGDLGFRSVSTSVGRLGVLVCWDQWYPEAARLMALDGAEVLIYPTAIGWDHRDSDKEKARQLDAWITVQRGHAIANGLPVLAINRVGREAAPGDGDDGIEFWGNSFAADCQGEILAQAGSEKDEVIIVELDTERIDKVRRAWPFLRDRRIDAYDGLTERFREGDGQRE